MASRAVLAMIVKALHVKLELKESQNSHAILIEADPIRCAKTVQKFPNKIAREF